MTGQGRPAPAKRAAAKKAAVPRPSRQPVVKPVVRKAAAGRAASSRSATKAPVKKTAAKAPAKKATAQKAPAQKAPAQKVPAKKATAQKVPAKKATAQRGPAKTATAKTVPAKKLPARRVPVQQAAKKLAPQRIPASRMPARGPVSSRSLPPPRRPAGGHPPRSPRPPRPPRRPLFPAPRVGDPNRRLRFSLAVVMLVLAVFGGRLVQLQGLNGQAVAATALANRQRSEDLTAHRGDILDRTGATLATTVDRYNITADQRLVAVYGQKDARVPDTVKAVSDAARVLSPLLGMSIPALTEKLTGQRAFVYVKKGVEPEAWRQIARLNVPGILAEDASRRTYPGGQVAANVVGFLNSTGTPQGGIESSMQSVLKGTDGKLTYERGSGGQQIATGVSSETDPVAGKDVQLTLDRDLTWKAQQLLAQQVKATGSESGQLVAMNPKTGEIYALVSVPTYDPNDPGRTPIANLQNSAVSSVFEPGSTSKVITAAAALEEGKATLETKLRVDGEIRRGGRVFHDSHQHGVEKLTFAGVLAQSSNVGTIRVGEKVPATDMYNYLRKFGIGSKTGVGLGESAGILAPVDEWNNSQRYTVLFGQGLSVTAVQSASVFATIANNGVRVTPRVVQAVSGPDGALDPVKPGAGTRVISQRTAQSLRTALEKVVSDDGTAVQASVPGYRVAGKTGTAQAYDDSCGCYRYYTASFVGMAPADDPELVVAVYLQKAKRNYFGGTAAAPVFQQVMTYALARYGIEPSGTKPPKVPQTWK